MKHTIRFFILFFALVMAGAGNVWAADITTSDIIINILPNSDAGTVTVTNIQYPDPATDTEVTITVTPASGYSIDADHIMAEKMVDALAPRRAPGMASSLPVSGNNPFTFIIPEGYTGAYVTVNFYKKITGFTQITSLSQITDMDGNYQLTADVSGVSTSLGEFKGTLDGGFHKIIGSSAPLFASTDGAIIRNIIFEDVNISSGDDDGDAGAVTCKATGNTRIYNCGILPTSTERDKDGNITGFSGSTISGTGNVGGLVGKLTAAEGKSPRVINCYSYATISGGNIVAGIVGNIGYAENGTITQSTVNSRGMVVNCMFYGDITSGSSKYPVYGGATGAMIKNDANNGVNPYCYYRKNAKFDDSYSDIANYKRSWPAEEKNLTRFEYYRSILNSNRHLCTYWVTDKAYASQTAADTALIAKWVLDPTIAPYPILKKWGKYPSVINKDPVYRYNPSTGTNELRSSANEWEGRRLRTITVEVNAGGHHAGSGATSKTLTNVPVLDMDTLNCDYAYAKIQLPYYNELFGDPSVEIPAPSDDEYISKWNQRYGGNYKEYVVTGWDVSGGSAATNYNFADRNSYSGRVFAQGGYFYVPEGVSSITITAHWGKAVYLSNRGNSIDRVKVTALTTYKTDLPFTPAGTVSQKFGTSDNIFKPAVTTDNAGTIYGDLQDAIKALQEKSATYPTVYDQAIVLVGNHQVKNGSVNSSSKDGTDANYDVSYLLDNKWHPFTFMSADFDIDDEPDFCLQLQFRKDVDRPGIQPIRFDFLPVVELGLAVRHDNKAYAIGIMVPQGHFEVTETALMRTTQFEYDGFTKPARTIERIEDKSPVILNGGEFEMFTVRYHDSNRTSYFLLGGNVWVHRFAPGAHPNTGNKPKIYLCPINVIGGQVKELYLTGLYRPELNAPSNQGAPLCYIDGGKFDIMAGAGYDKVEAGANVTFKINHSKISEFYGGGINGSNPISGDIDVTIDNSMVDKYCGGPKVGVMVDGKTVTTHATGTTFGVFYGGGNGGNSYYRQLQRDGDMASTHIGTWTGDWNWTGFNPLGKYDDDIDAENKGYHAEYEFEVFNQSNGVSDQITQRGFIKWIQFGITSTGNVSNTLENCKVTGNFYGGGNLATVNGNVSSTLTNTQVSGSVFGAGFSAAIPTFQVQDKESKTFPSIDFAGTITDGNIPYAATVYEWTNEKLEGKDEAYMKANPTYSKEVNGETKWYCYTWNSLTNLGAVTGNVSLTIDGNTVADKNGKVMTVGESVYGGGEESGVDSNTTVSVTGGTIGTVGAGVTDGNVYGGGKGKEDDETAGLVKGKTNVSISGSPVIKHNVYGGGAYGSVGTFTYNATTGLPETWNTENDKGKCTVTITGGTIGTTGKENGMVFGSSRGDVGQPGGITDKQAWVHSTQVTIGDAALETGPTIKGSVYGGGENGHTFTDALVEIKKGTIGITDAQTDGGARYPYRGNVYGGGCGTDTYTVKEDAGTENEKTKTYFNRLAGIVEGNTEVNISGGHVVHNVYGGGAMGSVGVFTREASDNIHVPGKITGLTSGGKCTITVSGGMIGNTGAKMINPTGGPDDFGHVFGGARGQVHDLADYPNLERVVYVDNTDVTISDNAFITGSVYGGSESGHVRGNTVVKIQGGQIGCGVEKTAAYIDTDWNATSLNPTAHWTYSGDHSPYDQYAGTTGYNAEGGATTATDGHTFYGNVFGGGSGYYPYAPGKWLRSAGQVGGTATVTISGGHILNNVYGGCEMADVDGAVSVTMTGGTVGVPSDSTNIVKNPTFGHIYGAGMGDKRIFFNTSTNVASTTVSVTGGTVYGSVYGGGEDGHVLGNATTTISKEAGEEKVAPVIGCDGKSGYDGNVFGGGQGSSTALTAGVVGGNVNLDILDGEIKGSVYGGGRIASVGTNFAMVKIEDPNNPGQMIDNPLYGKMQDGDTHGCLTVNLKGGTIEQNVYGGCMGTSEDIALGVSKNVTVELNNGVADDAQGCAVVGSIFGCNNVNSSPEGTVNVHIHATQHAGKSQIVNTAATGTEGQEGYKPAVEDAKTKGSYDVKAVYGGGNMAAYVPKDLTTGTTNVIIDGCGRTSIQQVYGGGNAASTPATNVTVNGTYEIDEVFGGGNGKDKITINGVLKDNPGANVGFKDYSEEESTYDTKEKRQNETFVNNYVYGTGKASVNIYGGTVHRVFGGSNTKGNVRQTAVTMLEEAGGCDFCVDEAYGGGKSAPMDAEAKLLMACIPGLQAAYGGAEAADIQGNVTLNITNGTFERVFGGNNKSGTISGAIKVNVSEIGCKPIIIGELYGGGNLAAYSIYGYHEKKDANNQVVTDDSGNTVWEVNQTKVANGPEFDSPEVNVMSFTSIGTIYGGGYGTPAVMVGSPTVNVSVAEGAWKDYVGESTHYEDDGYMYNSNGYKGETLTITDENGSHNVVLPSHNKGKIGAINNVFGGGNAAKVIGNTNVKIGTLSKVTIRDYVEKEVNVGASVEGLYTRSGAGTVASPYIYTETGASDVAEDGVTYYEEKDVDKDVIGADIRGNVYGGGNEAEVTGNTNVQIGKKQ